MSNIPASKGQAGSLALIAGLAAVLMIASHVAGKAARDALFLTSFDVAVLPQMMFSSAAISVATVFAFSFVMTRFGPAYLVPRLYAASGLLLGLQWFAMGARPDLVSIILYIHVSVVNAILISGFWSLINERFDPYTAKQTIARLAAAAAFGGLLGGLAAKLVATAIDTRSILLMLGAAHGVCALTLGVLARGQPRTPAREQSPEFVLTPLKRNPLIRRMALLALLIATTAAILDYLLKSTAANTLSDEELIGFFSYFYMIVGLGSFLLQSLVGGKALRWLGLGGAMAVWPLVVLGGTALALAVKQLLTVTLLRGGANLFYNSFFRTGFEVLYTPIAAADKRAGKVLIDVGADRSGDMLGSLIVMGILLLPAATDQILLGGALVLAALCLLLIYLLHHGYVGQLADNLRSGRLKAEEITPLDATTLHTLAVTRTDMERDQLLRQIAEYQGGAGTHSQPAAPPVGTSPQLDPMVQAIADLRSADPARVRRVLANHRATPVLVPHILLLLQEQAHLTEVFEVLRPVAATATGQLVDALLDHRVHPVIRRRIPLLVARADNQRAVDGLLAGLADEEPDVQYRCSEGLKRLRQHHPGLDFRAMQVRQLLDRALAEARARLDSRDPPGVPEPQAVQHLFNLLGALHGSIAMELCFQALQSRDHTQEGTALEYLENTLSLELRNALWPIIAAPSAPAKTGRPPRQMLQELLRVSKPGGGKPGGDDETVPDKHLATGAILGRDSDQREE